MLIEALPRSEKVSGAEVDPRTGVDETTAMKISGHKTRSMLLRYNIVTERETADALPSRRRLSLDAAEAVRKRKGDS